jgi:hypothetical protein
MRVRLDLSQNMIPSLSMAGRLVGQLGYDSSYELRRKAGQRLLAHEDVGTVRYTTTRLQTRRTQSQNTDAVEVETRLC